MEFKSLLGIEITCELTSPAISRKPLDSFMGFTPPAPPAPPALFPTGGIIAIAISPDGRTVASGGYRRTAKLWNLSNGRLRRTLSGHLRPIYSIAFNPQGSTLASGSNSEEIKLWNLRTGEVRHTLSAHSKEVRSVTFSPQGSTLASGSGDRTIKLWNPDTGEVFRTLKGAFASGYVSHFQP